MLESVTDFLAAGCTEEESDQIQNKCTALLLYRGCNMDIIKLTVMNIVDI